MNPTNNKNLPSRLRESSFRRYEPYIKSAVAIFPELLIIDSTQFNGSLSTFASRTRDAMASLAVYHWTSELVNMDKFDEVYPRIKVSHVMSDRVLIGSSENIREYYQQQNLPPSQFECLTPATAAAKQTAYTGQSQTTSIETVTSHAVAVSLSQDTHDKGVELKLLAGLAALRALSQPIQIEIDNEQATWLEDNFDVVVTKVTDTTYNLQ